MGCVQGSELLSGFLQPDKPLENHYPPSFPMGSSQPSFAQDSPLGYDPMAGYSQTSNTLPQNFDTEQYRLVHMRREYQKMLLDVEKKIIENKISWIDQANQADQMMTCPDPFLTNTALPPPAPITLPGEISPDKFSHAFPVFGSEIPLQDTHLPLDLASKETQIAMPCPQGSVSKTHKIPVRRNSNSRIQPYTSHTPTSLPKHERREEAGEGVKKRQSHNAIEERYRKRINLRIQELKSIVAPDEPLPKSNILAKALIYIRDLEEKNKSLEDRIVEMSGFKSSSSSSESSPPNMTSSPPALDTSINPNRQPRKNPRSNNAKIFFCLFTIVLCLCAPDPISLRELPSAFASRDQFGGLGSAVFRSRTLLYLSESTVGTSLRQSSSLINPFSLLFWSVRLFLVSLSLVVLVYSTKLLFPRYISADQSHFIKLSRQAGVKFREKRLNQSLSLLDTAFLDLGFYLDLSKPRLILSLFLEATCLSFLRLIHSTYLRFFTSSQRHSELNLPLFHEVILSLHLFQRVQTARDCHFSSLYSAFIAHSLSQSYKRTLPPYLVQYSRQSLLQLLHKNSNSFIQQLITAILKLSVGYDVETSHVCTRQDFYFWCNLPQETEEWDFDREIQTQVFCDELSVLLQSTVSLRHTKEDSRHALRFSAHIQSLPSSTDELTHWWATLAVMASDWKLGNTSDPHSYSNFFKNVPSSLITSDFILPKALVLSSRFRLSTQSSSLHRPVLLVRLSQEANELIWSSLQQDTLKADSKELFLLLQALCCKWVQDGLIQLWKKSGCVKTQYDILQSYLTGLFILDKLAQRYTFLTDLLSHQTSLTFTLSNSNPCQIGTQLDAIRQESLILSY